MVVFLCTTEGFLVQLKGCIPTTIINFRMTVTPKRNPVPLGSHSPLGLPSLWPPRIHFLSPWICLPWTFHVNRIAQLWPLGTSFHFFKSLLSSSNALLVTFIPRYCILFHAVVNGIVFSTSFLDFSLLMSNNMHMISVY